jgi:glyoxylase-like metal-dependent hydrolase (beta-lactamase superfamily II)
MKIGDYQLFPILTSYFRLDGGAMFGIIPKTLWNKKSPADEDNRIQMVTRSLLLASETRRILIDTGNGHKWTDKFKNIYEIDNSIADLESSLAHVGFKPEDITDVINTHLHFDHAGGNTKIEKGKIVPTFQNARYWVSRKNWEVANSPTEKDQGSFMVDDWNILIENKMINFIEGKSSVFPNIEYILSDGHTPGMVLPVIKDQSNTMVYCADLVPTSNHIKLAWIMAYDVQPTITINEKRELYSTAIEKDWMLYFEHDPEVIATTIKHDGRHFVKNKIIKFE